MGNLWRTENDCYVDENVRRLYEILLHFRLWNNRSTSEHYTKRDCEQSGR